MSYIPAKPPYQTVPEIADALFRGKGVSPEDEDRLARMADIATGLLDRKCGRTFGTVHETRLFDAPGGAELGTPDLVTLTTLTAYGAPLLEGVDFEMLPLNRDPLTHTYQSLRLFINGVPGNWDALDLLDPPDEAISVTADWAMPPPVEIVQACEMLACRLWHMRRLGYDDSGGNTVVGRDTRPNGIWITEILELITPYIKDPVPVVRGRGPRVG